MDSPEEMERKFRAAVSIEITELLKAYEDIGEAVRYIIQDRLLATENFSQEDMRNAIATVKECAGKIWEAAA